MIWLFLSAANPAISPKMKEMSQIVAVTFALFAYVEKYSIPVLISGCGAGALASTVGFSMGHDLISAGT
jgi:hypothetical protein